MPSLEFVGKSRVRNHHRSGVPFRELVPVREKSLTDNFSLDDNLIIHGDNLHALKALLPHYAGLVKCIYIDPPYNTGNEGWCYNDKVNSPKIREWIKQNANPVDGDDMLRHDKWLCMMWPRLNLLKDLLADDGVIFISIDDNEQHRLRAIMDEIFGEENFISNVSIKSNPGGRDYGGIAKTHDYAVVYAKNLETELSMIGTEENNSPQSDALGIFELRELRNRNAKFNISNRPNLHYPFYVNANSVDEHGLYEISLEKKEKWVETYPIESQGIKTVWRWGKSKVEENLNINVKAKRKRDKSFQIVEKFRRKGKRERSILDDTVYRNERGTLCLKSIFGGESAFDYPKSLDLVKRLIELGSEKNSVVLDSFAGSGTAAHAVLALNKEDGGNRKFILVECEDYADKLTAERVRRVIKGVPKAKDENLEKGLGGSFTYCELGVDFDIEKMLSGESLPSYESLAVYIFKNCTGKVLKKEEMSRKSFFVGQTEQYEVYLIYEDKIEFLRGNESGLTHKNLETITKIKSQKQKLVFATAQFVDPDLLKKEKVEFCLLPYAIHKIVG